MEVGRVFGRYGKYELVEKQTPSLGIIDNDSRISLSFSNIKSHKSQLE
jgi:hypothetical protein